jgi:hypothetical protein
VSRLMGFIDNVLPRPRHDASGAHGERGGLVRPESRPRRVRVPNDGRAARGRVQLLPRPLGHASSRTWTSRTPRPARSSGSASSSRSTATTATPCRSSWPGDLGAVVKLKDTPPTTPSGRRAPRRPPANQLPRAQDARGHPAVAHGGGGPAGAGAPPAPEGGPEPARRARPRAGQMTLAGQGEMHLEVARYRLKERFGVDVDSRQAAYELPRDRPGPRPRLVPPQEADRRRRPVRRPLPARGTAHRAVHPPGRHQGP